MNKLGTLCALLSLSSCAKKEIKPLHTEPWLAHPPEMAAERRDAAVPAARYAIGGQSQIHFEVPSKHGALRGSFTRVSGELALSLAELAQSRGQVEVDLGSLTLGIDGAPADNGQLLERAQSALGALDAGGAATASFELDALEDVSPARLEPAPGRDGGAAFTRRARATAVGKLLLHGFRVQRRAPLEVEFSFTGDPELPSSIVIRSRVPFVISLETHELSLAATGATRKSPKSAAAGPTEARVSVELYGSKIQ